MRRREEREGEEGRRGVEGRRMWRRERRREEGKEGRRGGEGRVEIEKLCWGLKMKQCEALGLISNNGRKSKAALVRVQHPDKHGFRSWLHH